MRSSRCARRIDDPMKFSTRTRYGLKAILVLASRFGEGSLSVSQIAKKEGISVPYLEQILNGLKKKGFVKSVRGPQGGYILAKKPSEISLETLFYALVDKDLSESKRQMTISSETAEVAIADFLFWGKFQSFIKEGLSEMTLKGLIDDARRLKKKPNSSHTFNI